jgi:starch synthase
MSAACRSLWLVTREYAGIAEAGGVKNVACSLAEGLAKKGLSVTVFIPRYGCVSLGGEKLFSIPISIANEIHTVGFSRLLLNGVEIIFIDSHIYLEKHSVYVYTESELGLIPGAVRGKGHFDVDIMNMLFQKAVLEYARKNNRVPDIVHCQDAHAAVLPALARTNDSYIELFARTGFVVTIHNAGPGYRQVIPGLVRAEHITGLPASILEKALFNGNVEPFLLAAEYAVVTTVSPWYAEELTSFDGNEFSEGFAGELHRRGVHIAGITNGIDYERYDPRDPAASLLPFAFDPITGDLDGKYRCRSHFLAAIGSLSGDSEITCYGSIDPDPHAVYFSYHGRIAWQKGIDVFERSAKLVMDHIPSARFVILGQGDPVLESALIRMASRYTGRFVYLQGYERSLARMAVAISDFLVLPSVFEPCGLEDFIGQIYGTIPVAHAVGGLNKIIHGRTGFLYASGSAGNDAAGLARLLIDEGLKVADGEVEGCAGIEEYCQMIKFSAARVRDVCNWDSIIRDQYLPLYEKNMLSLS